MSRVPIGRGPSGSGPSLVLPPGAEVYRDEADGSILIVPRSDRRMLPWLAALGAADIAYRVAEWEDGRWCIRVPERLAGRALSELVEYERVNRGWPPRVRRLAFEGGSGSGGAALGVVLLCLWYWYTGPADGRIVDFAGMDGGSVRAGEWWRCVTALTLHADFVHIASNAVCLFVFTTVAGVRWGTGLAWAVTVVAGAYGNLVSAVIMDTPGRAVGASTAVFGLLGVLAADQFIRHWRTFHDLRSVWSRAWVAAGAGIAVLAFLGTGARSDLAGHLSGFLVGVSSGGLLSFVERRPPAGVQWISGAAAMLTVLSCWSAALICGAWAPT